VLLMEESPPARSVAIWECAGDQAMNSPDRICSLAWNFTSCRFGSSTNVWIGATARHVWPLSHLYWGPKDANKMYKVLTRFPRGNHVQ
jgi:hypothetical protein